MVYATVLLYILLIYSSYKNKKCVILIGTPIYSILFLYLVFSGFFINKSIDGININIYLLLIAVTYFYMEFFLFLWAYRRGVVFIFAFCILISAIPYSGILIPMNAIILLYPDIHQILPSFTTPFVNLFFIYFFILLFFYVKNARGKILLAFMFVSISIISKWNVKSLPPPPKIAIIQLGLYYKNGGSSKGFVNDLNDFLKKNKADIVIFSENMFYGYKSKYSKEKTSKLLNDIGDLGLFETHAFLFSFYGFYDINNIVSVFKYRDKTIINQKRVLIPYIEKKGLLNEFENMSSYFLSINDNYNNEDVFFNKWLLNTSICYDALFPRVGQDYNISVVQSDYRQLNHGYGYDNTLRFGAILSKFSNAMNTNLFINVQNYGGTIVMDNKWNINNEFFALSKREPFLYLDKY